MTALSQNKRSESDPITENIRLCPDGVYRWTFEFDMLRNPTILFSVWKVLGIAFGTVYLFTLIVDLLQGVITGWTGLWSASKVFVIHRLAHVLCGRNGRKPTMVAPGSNVSAKDTKTSEFKSVEIVKVRRKRHTIHVDQRLDKNQVYAEDADFDFVEKFILDRCVKAKINGKGVL